MTGGIERVNRIINRYSAWIETYGTKYKKTHKLTRSVERMRKYVRHGFHHMSQIFIEY